jgi:protein-arginine kinase activator protein McsA
LSNFWKNTITSQVGELTFLRRWKEEILTKIKSDAPDAPETVVDTVAAPTAVDRAADLRAQIESAIHEERYEDAAMLRDELKRLES